MLRVACLLLVLSTMTVAQDLCLDALKGTPDNPEFDQQHDRNSEGGSFSCDVEARASAAFQVLEAFRYGFLHDSHAHLELSIHFPLLIKKSQSDWGKVQNVKIKNVGDWLKFKAKHFSANQRVMIACANLANVRIHKKWSGFAIGPGIVWFFNSVNFGLRVGQINLSPISDNLLRESCGVEVGSK